MWGEARCVKGEGRCVLRKKCSLTADGRYSFECADVFEGEEIHLQYLSNYGGHWCL